MPGLVCLLVCALAVTESAASGVPRRVLRRSGLLLAGPGLGAALPSAAAAGEGLLHSRSSKLVDELAELGAGALGDGLRIAFTGDLDARGLWQGLCSTLSAEAAGAEIPPDSSGLASCRVTGAGLVLEYVPASMCGPLRASARTSLARATAVVLGVSAKQGMHLGDALPLRCPTSDPTAAVASLVGSLHEALGDANVPIVVLGPAALCPHRLPPELEAAVHDAQAADPAARNQMVAECAAALAAGAVPDDDVGVNAAGWRGGSAAAAEAVCAMSLLSANGVEEWNAQVAGAVQLLQDTWLSAGAAAPSVAFVDMHRLTKGQCEAVAPAPGAAAAPEDNAAQVFPTLTVPVMLEVMNKLGTQRTAVAAARR